MTLRPKTPPPVGSRKHREMAALLRDAGFAEPVALPPEPPAKTTGQQYANFIGAPGAFLLNAACRVLNDAFGEACCCYLVGSALKKRDWRDVDVRCILDDEAWDRLFPDVAGESAKYCDRHALWSLLCSTISLHLRQQTGLPIDFQIQRQSQANEQFPRSLGHDRQALGLFLK